MSDKDTITKEYMQDPEFFADAFNYLLHDGRQVIRPEYLHELDTTTIIDLPGGDKAYPELDQKYRDVLKLMTAMADENAAYLILGVENQSELHYSMPVRNMLYDAVNYDRQTIQAKKSHRSEKDHGNSSAEFLSGFYHTDKLIPVITLVIFWNPDEWTAPRSLHEMMAVKDRNILSYVPDYRINLISPVEIKDFEKLHTELREAMKFVKYSKDKKGLEKLMKEDQAFMNLSRKTADMINIITGSDFKYDNTKESVNMCQAIEDMKKEAVEQVEEKLRKAENDAKKAEDDAKIAENKAKKAEETTINMIRTTMKNQNCSADQVMLQFGFSDEQREYYKKLMA